MKNKGLFITGTDTDVGKTYIGSQLVCVLHENGISIVPRKPIESGCEFVDGNLQPDDARHYFEAVDQNISLQEICPYRFEPAISPQRAAKLANNPLYVRDMAKICLDNISENDFLFVEGAGGFYSPLCEDGLNADLAKAMQIPILLVANDQLGCINHILLTVEAIKQNELELYAVILNQKEHSHDKEMNNLDDLENLLDVAIFSVKHNESIKNNSALINHISKLFIP